MPPKPWGPFRWAPIVSTLISTIKTYSIADHQITSSQTASMAKAMWTPAAPPVSHSESRGLAGQPSLGFSPRSTRAARSLATVARGTRVKKSRRTARQNPARDVAMANQLAEDAVRIEPVLASEFPAKRGFAGYFCNFAGNWPWQASKRARDIRRLSPEFPTPRSSEFSRGDQGRFAARAAKISEIGAERKILREGF